LEESNTHLVSVVILNYNGGELLLNCVESVLKSTHKKLEVIVVDNKSEDQSQKKCKEKFSQINLIENEKNLGYCEGNNIGIKNAKGDFVVILNPDTTVESNWLEEFLSAYQKHGDGLYQPKIFSLSEKKILQSTGNMIHLFGFGYARDKGVKDSDKHHSIEQIGFASGTCLFTRKKLLEKIGLFDPFLFLYHDDLDLGWRAAQLGIKSFYVPSAIIFHAESYLLKWSAQKFFWLERNRKYCLLTHYSKETYRKMSFLLFLVDISVWVFYFYKGFISSKIKAELDIIKNKKIILKKYHELEEKKIVSDEDLIKLFPDSIFVPENVSGGILSKSFNNFLLRLSKKAKKSILSNK